MGALDPSLVSSLLAALLAWSGQIVVLAAAGALAAFAIAHPKARLLFWQALLLAMLLLPFAEPRKQVPVEAAVTVETTVAVVPLAAPPASRSYWREEDWLLLLVAGAALRLAWIAAGFLRLRRYRLQATPLAVPPVPFAAGAARWYVSDAVPGPVTYGWRRPVILLPSRVLALPAEVRDAIQSHELIHVHRGDGAFVLAEAILRSLLWFHPAVWFVLGRIQLAREQTVDREAVALLDNRDSYLDALLAVAEFKLRTDLTPAPLFLRKRHLVARVNALVHGRIKEINMSRPRIAAATAAVCTLASAAIVAAVWMFPIINPVAAGAQTAPDSPGISISAGAELLHRAAVIRPEGSTAAGTVTLQATLGSDGEVTDAKVLSGPEELRKAALSSVLQWHYQPGPALAQISIQFEPAKAVVTGPAAILSAAPPPPPPPPPPGAAAVGTVNSIQVEGLSADAERELRSRLPVHEGDSISRQDVPKIAQVVQAFDSHLSVRLMIGANGAISGLRIGVGPAAGGRGGPQPSFRTQSSGACQAQAGAVCVGAGVQAAKLISHPNPIYPPVAKQARVQGQVVLDALIGTDGTVQQLNPASSSSPLLTQAAMDAVKQWVYQPTMLNGQPVPVKTTITVNFTLTDSTAADGVVMPIPTYRPEPQYSEQARAARWQGSVLVSALVDTDGRTRNVKVLRPLGLGLDEKAIEAVSQWRFRPGTKDGTPVPVQVQIEVSFRLDD